MITIDKASLIRLCKAYRPELSHDAIRLITERVEEVGGCHNFIETLTKAKEYSNIKTWLIEEGTLSIFQEYFRECVEEELCEGCKLNDDSFFGWAENYMTEEDFYDFYNEMLVKKKKQNTAFGISVSPTFCIVAVI